MFKMNTLAQLVTATITTAVLVGCGSDSNSSDDKKTAENPTHNTTPEASPASGLQTTENLKFTLPESNLKAGKSELKVTITDKDGTPKVGITPMMMPTMYMVSGHIHSTPHDGCGETDANGVATCNAHFLMPSEMMDNGKVNVMGRWDLAFSVGMGEEAEKVTYSPKVTMVMGNTTRAVLNGGDADKYSNMGTPAKRPYFIFNDGLTGMADNRSIKVFVASKENMMSFPALETNKTLNDGAAPELSLVVNSIEVKVSTDKNNWITATSEGKGVWKAVGLTGLVDNQPGEVHVQLAVNSVAKTRQVETDNGSADVNYATLKVTPGGMAMSGMMGDM